MNCQVTVEQGTLEGKVCTTYYGKRYYSFEGIPYAKPPVGKLRFRCPQEPEKWTGVRDATKPGNNCAQINPYSPKSLIGSEDCLYLNVYTPCLPAEKLDKLPVIFFVHGGRFLVGYGDYYQPDYILQHDVILVTINYRLNIFGFLCLHTPEVPGNAGLKDSAMALKWVKNNIKRFNGDENNITACGESAGSGVVTFYLTSKMTRGLCHKIISQSGNLLSDLVMVEADPVQKARHIAKLLGQELADTRSLYDFLMNASVEDLIFAMITAEVDRPSYVINANLLPVVEKQFEGIERFIEEYPIVSIRGGRINRMPILTTINSHEGALFLPRNEEGKIEFQNNLQHFIPRFTGIQYDTPRAVKFAKGLNDFYFKGKEMTKDEYLDLVSDAYFGRDTVMFVEHMSKYIKDNYLCYFSYSGNMNTSLMRRLGCAGATHGDLIQYLFYRKTKADKCTEKDKKIVDFLSEAWCNFAKNGKPTWKNQPVEWLPYDVRNKYTLHVDDDIKLVFNPNWERYCVWDKLMGERSKL
ncbi:PREDICTED: esterase FE4-like [Papilio polytes]|uniref:esterase FE4-like n=1 Tax=Papilio polytes TaxID=76194 RepID=UPI000676210E|nr:PREDICTED: esterase FE4-like [Papilio polytes]